MKYGWWEEYPDADATGDVEQFERELHEEDRRIDSKAERLAELGDDR